MTSAQKVASILLDNQAVRLQPDAPFTWASGRLSPIYCDNRILLSFPDARDAIKTALISECKEFNSFDVIAGVATAGIPHGALLADALNLPFIYVRNKAKAHGRQNQIEGKFEQGQHILVIEDLISTGGSSLAAVEALRTEGGRIAGLMSIFTYGLQESYDRFKEAQCPVKSLTDYDCLVQMAIEGGYISETHRSILEAWRSNPAEWSEKQKKITT